MLFLATGLAVCGIAGVAARPDDVKVWQWPQVKEYRDGPVRMEVESLTGERDLPEWEITFRVTDPDTGLAPADDTLARFAGAKAVDDRGADLPFTRSPKTPRSLSFPARPSPKAKSVYVYFGEVPGRSNVKLALPAATVRGLTAKTSYFRKAAP